MIIFRTEHIKKSFIFSFPFICSQSSLRAKAAEAVDGGDAVEENEIIIKWVFWKQNELVQNKLKWTRESDTYGAELKLMIAANA